MNANANDAIAYNGLGDVLKRLGRFAKAAEAYRKAVELRPKEPAYLGNPASLYSLQHFEEDAAALLRELVEPDPKNHWPYLALASVHKHLGNEEKSAEYLSQAVALIPNEDWYNLACFEAIRGSADVAFEHLRHAVQGKEFDRAWAWNDPDLERIQDDPRFS